MGRYIREYNCEDCGTAVRRGRAAGQPLVCTECGIRRHRAYTISVARKEGAGYERWLAANKAYLARLTAGVR